MLLFNYHLLPSTIGHSIITVLTVLLLARPDYSGVARAIRVPATVYVNKCCRLEEHLDASQKCTVGGSDQWWPVIYLIGKRDYYQPSGEAPRFIHPREDYIPPCKHPEYYSNNRRMALFSNGSLYLSEKNLFLDATDYCIDKDAAILCFPSANEADSLTVPKKLTKIRKCCGNQAAYAKSSDNCVAVKSDSEVFRKKLLTNSSMVDVIFGFPDCKTNNAFTIAAKFKEENLELNTGSITLDSSQQFKWDEYCLEHVVSDTESSSVNVFTCAEHLSVKETIAETKMVFTASPCFTVTIRLDIQFRVCFFAASFSRTYASFCTRLDCWFPWYF